ncbi:hypothetical protein AQ860_11340 [Burkholderia pseudomallei]|nr:hypothetical protein AQ760_17550 [Burkholderia pseudomallei]OMZ16421.1 hypothetical protein AQ859_13080 [Burkholderia pseudomallei]OMZ37310.1 hypothetical protein AQ860_11340 [Burkholderia pseudomallei]
MLILTLELCFRSEWQLLHAAKLLEEAQWWVLAGCDGWCKCVQDFHQQIVLNGPRVQPARLRTIDSVRPDPKSLLGKGVQSIAIDATESGMALDY